MDDIKNLKAVDRIKVLKENDLDAVKVSLFKIVVYIFLFLIFSTDQQL